MTTITRIKAVNFRGEKEMELKLTGKDLLLGKKGTGKSSLLNIIRIGVTGKDPDPRVGSQPSSIFIHGSGNPMTLTVMADDNGKFFGVTRTYSRTEKGVSGAISLVPNTGQETRQEMEAKIREVFGNFPIMYDLRSFDGLSDNKKRAYFFSLTKDGGECSLKQIKKLMVDRGSALPDELVKAWNENEEAGLSSYSNLSGIADMVKAKLKTLRADKKNLMATAKKLAEFKNENEDTDTGRDPHEIKEEMEDVRAKLSGVASEVAVIVSKNERRTGLLNNMQSLTISIDKRPLMNPHDIDKKDKKFKILIEKDVEYQRARVKVQMAGECPLGHFDCEFLVEATKIQKEKEEELKVRYTEVQTLRKEYEGLHLRFEAHEERIRLQEKLRDNGQALDALGETIDPEQLSNQQEALTHKLKALIEEWEAASKAYAEWEAAEKAAGLRVEVEGQYDIYKQVESVIGPTGIQGAVIEKLMEDLTKKIQGVMIGDKDQFSCQLFDDAGKEIFKIGLLRGGEFIEIPSGGEQVLFDAALLTGLVMLVDPKNKTLLFELAELDAETCEKFLVTIGALVDEGKLDNVVVAYNHYDIDVEACEGWQVVKL